MLKFYMVEEIGTVKSVDGTIATVEVVRKSMCEGCTAGCRQEDQSMEIDALNEVGAKVGQTVRVSIKALSYLKGTMIVYALPALALVLGAVIGRNLLNRVFPHVDRETLSGFVGLGVFAVTFIAVKIWTTAVSRKPKSKPVIEEILN
jgi:sigma-E factor negative regulatory protein RseC